MTEIDLEPIVCAANLIDENQDIDKIKSRVSHGLFYECSFYYLKLGFSLNFVNGEAIVISVDGPDERKEYWNELSIFVRSCDKKIMDFLSSCASEKLNRHSKQLKYFPIADEIRKKLYIFKGRHYSDLDKEMKIWKSATNSANVKSVSNDSQEPLKVRTFPYNFYQSFFKIIIIRFFRFYLTR